MESRLAQRTLPLYPGLMSPGFNSRSWHLCVFSFQFELASAGCAFSFQFELASAFSPGASDFLLHLKLSQKDLLKSDQRGLLESSGTY